MKQLVTTKELAEIYGYSDKYISELVVKHGHPKAAHNKYDLEKSFKWYIDYLKNLHEAEIKRLKEEDTKARLERARAEEKELDLAVKKRLLIKSEDVLRSKMNDAALFKKSLLNLKRKLSPQLKYAKTEFEIAEIIDRETNIILNILSQLPPELPVDGLDEFTN